MDLFEDILDEAVSLGATQVSLENFGEPLLDPYLVERVEIAKRYGLEVFTISNGALLDEALAGRLISSGLDKIRISMSGAQKTIYEAIHRGLQYEVLHRNITDLLKVRGASKSPRIELSFVALAENQEEVENFKQTWIGIVDGVSCGSHIIGQTLGITGRYVNRYNLVVDLSMAHCRCSGMGWWCHAVSTTIMRPYWAISGCNQSPKFLRGSHTRRFDAPIKPGILKIFPFVLPAISCSIGMTYSCSRILPVRLWVFRIPIILALIAVVPKEESNVGAQNVFRCRSDKCPQAKFALVVAVGLGYWTSNSLPKKRPEVVTALDCPIAKKAFEYYSIRDASLHK
jgi:hypothetical protein